MNFFDPPQVLGELIEQEGIIVYQGARYKPLPAIAQVRRPAAASARTCCNAAAQCRITDSTLVPRTFEHCVEDTVEPALGAQTSRSSIKESTAVTSL